MRFVGDVLFLSVEKRKNQKRKSRIAVLPQDLLNSVVLGELYIGRCVCLLSPPIRLLRVSGVLCCHCFVAHANVILLSFGFREWTFSCLGSFPPRRHVRHPSAAQLQIRRWEVHARAVKKAWRARNWPSRRETRCIKAAIHTAPTIN